MKNSTEKANWEVRQEPITSTEYGTDIFPFVTKEEAQAFMKTQSHKSGVRFELVKTYSNGNIPSQIISTIEY